MGMSCFSLFEDFNKDDDDLLLTDEELRDVRKSRRKKGLTMRGPAGFEVKLICMLSILSTN